MGFSHLGKPVGADICYPLMPRTVQSSFSPHQVPRSCSASPGRVPGHLSWTKHIRSKDIALDRDSKMTSNPNFGQETTGTEAAQALGGSIKAKNGP